MRNKKGFTLIELLAVIVILAIIAVIATPIILGIVNDAREDARLRSVELYGKALEQAYMQASLSGENVELSELTPKYSGDRVVCTVIDMDESTGAITLEGCTVGGEGNYNLSNSKATAVE